MRLFFIWIIIIVVIAGLFIYSTNKYSFVIKQNWNISLPGNYTEIYELEEETCWLGDGIRYHIFEYNSNDKLTNLFDWQEEDCETSYYSRLSETVDGWLSEIDVLESYYPETSNCKYYYRQDDLSEILIFWNEDNCCLYILENFI